MGALGKAGQAGDNNTVIVGANPSNEVKSQCPGDGKGNKVFINGQCIPPTDPRFNQHIKVESTSRSQTTTLYGGDPTPSGPSSPSDSTGFFQGAARLLEKFQKCDPTKPSEHWKVKVDLGTAGGGE